MSSRARSLISSSYSQPCSNHSLCSLRYCLLVHVQTIYQPHNSGGTAEISACLLPTKQFPPFLYIIPQILTVFNAAKLILFLLRSEGPPCSNWIPTCCTTVRKLSADRQLEYLPDLMNFSQKLQSCSVVQNLKTVDSYNYQVLCLFIAGRLVW